MSSLGASASGPSAYQRSKAAGEAAVREPDAPAHTIFRPSVIFGEQDSFLNLFASLIRLAPVLPLASPRARFQPVWVEDVARCFVAALGDARTHGQVYELGGPRVTTLEELVAFVGATLGRRPAIVPLPASLAYLQALVLEYLPGHVMTRDNLRSMSVDNVCAGPFPSVFGFEPTPMEAVVPGYLAAAEINSRYQRFRNLAGR
jgi:NADH dehydrogenase